MTSHVVQRWKTGDSICMYRESLSRTKLIWLGRLATGYARPRGNLFSYYIIGGVLWLGWAGKRWVRWGRMDYTDRQREVNATSSSCSTWWRIKYLVDWEFTFVNIRRDESNSTLEHASHNPLIWLILDYIQNCCQGFNPYSIWFQLIYGLLF